MTDLLWPLLGLLAAWPLWKALQLGLVARAMRGMRLVRCQSRLAAEDEVPEAARAAVGRAEAGLAALGFAPGAWQKLDGPWAGRETWQQAFWGPGADVVLAQPAAVPAPGRPCDVTFMAFRADGEALYTMYGDPGRVIGKLDRVTVATGYPDTLADHLALHERATQAFLAGQAAVRPTEAELRARSDRELATYADGLVAAGLAVRDGDAVRLTWATAIAGARVSLRELAAVKAHQARLGGDALPVAEEVAAYHRLQAQQPNRAPGVVARWGGFAASFAVFWLSLGAIGVRPDSRAAAWLVGALVLHEAGHLLAMKAFGYETPRMLFVPLLGAVTVGKPGPRVTAWQRALMLLAGPVPGLLLGSAALAWHLWGPAPSPMARVAGLMLVAVNLPNLLPVQPLDGGRLVAMVAPRSGVVLLVAGVVAQLGFAWLVADTPALAAAIGAFAALSAMSVPYAWRVQRLVARLGPGEDRVAAAYAALRGERLGFTEKLALVKAAAEAPPPLSWGQAAAVLGLMGVPGGMAAGLAALGWFHR